MVQITQASVSHWWLPHCIASRLHKVDLCSTLTHCELTDGPQIALALIENEWFPVILSLQIAVIVNAPMSHDLNYQLSDNLQTPMAHSLFVKSCITFFFFFFFYRLFFHYLCSGPKAKLSSSSSTNVDLYKQLGQASGINICYRDILMAGKWKENITNTFLPFF